MFRHLIFVIAECCRRIKPLKRIVADVQTVARIEQPALDIGRVYDRNVAVFIGVGSKGVIGEGEFNPQQVPL